MSRPIPFRSISIDALRAFVAVVNSRGFTRAAEELGRTQPTISLQVKRLEELVDAPLFENTARFTLSQAGEACYSYGCRLLRLHDEMMLEISRGQKDDMTLRVGLPAELAEYFMSILKNAALKDNINMKFDLFCADSSSIIREFRLERLGVAVILSGRDEPTGRDEQKYLVRGWKIPLIWAGARQIPIEKGRPVPLVASADGSPYFPAAVAALKAAGLKFEVVCKTSNFSALKAAVASGIGVSPMFPTVLHEGLQRVEILGLAKLPKLELNLYIKHEQVSGKIRKFLLDTSQTIRLYDDQLATT